LGSNPGPAQQPDLPPSSHPTQVKELGKNACGPDGSFPALTKEQTDLFKEKIDHSYRINMVLDNLPVTVYDLEDDVSKSGGGAGRGGSKSRRLRNRHMRGACKGRRPPVLSPSCAAHQNAVPVFKSRSTPQPWLSVPPQNAEFVRPGFELGYSEGGRYFVYNHLRFNVLVHPTHGEYTRARKGSDMAMGEVDARKLLSVGGAEAATGGPAAAAAARGRQLLDGEGDGAAALLWLLFRLQQHSS
jgi:hypothetical protein